MLHFSKNILEQTSAIPKPEKAKAKKQPAQKITNRRKTAVEPKRNTGASSKSKTNNADDNAMNAMANSGKI